MLAVFLNGLNGKNSSRSIVRNIFSVYFFIQVSRLVIASIFLSHRLLSVISVIRIVSYIIT